MLREWTSSQYLGHANLKNALDSIARSFQNVALTPPGFILVPTTQSTSGGLGGYLRVGGATGGTFMFRIEGETYIKGAGITDAVSTGLDTGGTTCSLIPHSATDNTATGGFDVTAGYYRAGVLLVNASGVFSSICASSEASRLKGVSGGARMQALAYLVDELETSDIEDKAIVCFFVIGDGTNAFTSTTTLTINTDTDLYQCGGMALSTGQSTDGIQLLGLI
jgi:hypothetical protein